jgi:16S rRNA (cytosine967-C5)-methyltransferase
LKKSQQQAAVAVRSVLDGQTLDVALEAAGAGDAGPARSLIHELAYGTLRHYGTLDALTRALATRPITERTLASLVAVALYQIQHTRAPAFAVVDQAVAAAEELARPAAKALVNAILRRFLREREALLSRVLKEPVARWSHPRWWIARVRSDWPDHWQSILAAGNERPPLTLRVNLRRTTREDVLARFAARGIDATAVGAQGIVVKTPQPVSELPGFSEGGISVQDEGAQLAAALLDISDDMRVLDACAAPGGKTSHILERARASVTALDVDASRLSRVRENLQRLGLGDREARLIAADAAQPAQWWDGVAFDRILADVPCTASGVVRRHPDAKWLRRPSDVAAFAVQQAALLAGLWPTLAPGGLLLYATCSVFKEENETRIAQFLSETPGALRETLSFDDGIAHSGGQLLPAAEGAGHNHDAFFYALLRKR